MDKQQYLDQKIKFERQYADYGSPNGVVNRTEIRRGKVVAVHELFSECLEVAVLDEDSLEYFPPKTVRITESAVIDILSIGDADWFVTDTERYSYFLKDLNNIRFSALSKLEKENLLDIMGQAVSMYKKDG